MASGSTCGQEREREIEVRLAVMAELFRRGLAVNLIKNEIPEISAIILGRSPSPPPSTAGTG